MNESNSTAPQTRIICVDDLANEIRRIDGNHDKGAGAIAEQLAPWIEARLVTFVADDKRSASRA